MIKKIIMVLLVVVCIVSFASCSEEKHDEWPKTGLALQLPEPTSGKVDIGLNDDDSFSASLKETQENEYEKYLSDCKNKGFTIDSDSKSKTYEAFNEDGYKLSLQYFSGANEIYIKVDAPIEIGDLKWPIGSAGKAAPEPTSKKGKVEWEHDDSFLLYVGNTTFDDYNNYVDKCVESGFVVDYSKDDKYYRAENKDHYYLDVEYVGRNIMRIRVDKNDQELSTESEQSSNESSSPESSDESVTSETSSPESSESSETVSQPDSSAQDSSLVESTDNSVIRTEVKEAIDSYEDFVDRYCEFMKTYDSSNAELVVNYTEFLQEQIKVTKKFEDIEGMELNDAETLYYAEVSTRCSKKMLEVVASSDE